ncbi:DUF3566 domain-containing protein [Solihabitans fulvus]|uniref:DUF3566 domain-containing protein n=1 Tax=Solihabitans fulvus TaxID=1892852 RepID=UPI001CB75F57|nr:DUF3566 domain-containing protein [Solihabitans fulvus]
MPPADNHAPPVEQHAAPAAQPADLASSAPPPWQRVSSDTHHIQQDSPAAYVQHGVHPEQGFPAGDAATTRVRPVATGAAAPQGAGARTSVNLGASANRPTAAAPSARRPGRGPRRASLQVKRVDPWSVLKLALVLSIALFFVWLVAVGVLYGVLNGMGVWERINSTANELLQGSGDPSSVQPLITAGNVFGVAAVIGAVNIVLFTALATVGAFVYNVSADLAGGLELTLSERE